MNTEKAHKIINNIESMQSNIEAIDSAASLNITSMETLDTKIYVSLVAYPYQNPNGSYDKASGRINIELTKPETKILFKYFLESLANDADDQYAELTKSLKSV